MTTEPSPDPRDVIARAMDRYAFGPASSSEHETRRYDARPDTTGGNR